MRLGRGWALRFLKILPLDKEGAESQKTERVRVRRGEERKGEDLEKQRVEAGRLL